jgi:hypothetical protein
VRGRPRIGARPTARPVPGGTAAQAPHTLAGFLRLVRTQPLRRWSDPLPGACVVMRTAIFLVPALLASACAARVSPPPAEPEPARARAALATLHVDNRTDYRIAIFYRIATRTTSEVGIGQIAPRAHASVAPVPAGEPLLLFARVPSGAQLALPARSFPVDGEWTWVIHRDARFTPPDRPGAAP